jgi:3-deoxy-7-phosphoheptulonate synthase
MCTVRIGDNPGIASIVAGFDGRMQPRRRIGRRGPGPYHAMHTRLDAGGQANAVQTGPVARFREALPMNDFDDPVHDREVGQRNPTRDTTRIDDTRIDAVRPLITPALLMEKLPVSAATLAVVERSRESIAAILRGNDDRLIVVVGPCSIHDHAAAVEYAQRLRAAVGPLADALLVVMRTYFEKPRTTVGWKGYINDPHLDGTFAINEGLERARRLLLEIIEIGVPVGTEFLDLLSPQFISDLVAWGAIGARTTESQTHRQLASGLSCPVGFKNGTDGGIQVAVDAIVAAGAPHAFMGMTKMGQAAIFETRGNRDCHVILRGGKQPNYGVDDVDAACAALKNAGLRDELMIDVSHANSRKQHLRQIEVAAEIAQRIAAGERRIIGMMIESHLEEGRQDLRRGESLRRGVSITDACISWAQTEPVLQGLASAVRSRRR